jgi:DNA-binding CsgD family transcriptional regulator
MLVPSSCWLILLLFIPINSFAGNKSKDFQNLGWSALVHDSDDVAFRYFDSAYVAAKNESDIAATAQSLLYMGICTYSVSYGRGMDYATRAMNEFAKLSKSDPPEAAKGRARCLTLIATIYSRQGKYTESIALSREALEIFLAENDTSDYPGLIYNSLGVAYDRSGRADSSEYFHRLALQVRTQRRDSVYLPSSLMNVARIEQKNLNKTVSKALIDQALSISRITENRQAEVSSLLGLGDWTIAFEQNDKLAEEYFLQAEKITDGLSDKTYAINALDKLISLKKKQGHYETAIVYLEKKSQIIDNINDVEKQHILKSLELQFEVAEKDRKLTLVQKEKELVTLTNYLLWVSIGFLVVAAAGTILFLRRINKRDKQLIRTKEQLMQVLEKQKQLREQHLQNEIEHKESQLSAMTFKILQKNELFQELKERLDQEKNSESGDALNKILSRGLTHDQEWSDFNLHFESINKNFYSRLKQAYPDISPNDLKMCALIKLNLSTKAMAGILNISPDSVKTARYRLRKKLQLNTEDNLTEFILSL